MDRPDQPSPTPEDPTTPADRPALRPLTVEQIEVAAGYFRSRLIGQPEVARALTDILYRQSAYLKRAIEHPEIGGVPNDPAVLLFAGGSWGKTLAAELIPQALQPYGFAPFAILTPLPQDPEGSLNLDVRMFTVPFAVVLVERIEIAQAINARFVVKLAQLLEAGQFSVQDPTSGAVHRLPLGLTTFVFTSMAGEEEIRQLLRSNGRLGFLQASEISRQQAYETIERLVQKQLSSVPESIVRHVDEIIVFRPLMIDDLHRVFDAEIEHYRHRAFPGKVLNLQIEPAARDFLFEQAAAGLVPAGIHALRRTLQRHVDPTIYRSYLLDELSESSMDQKAVRVALVGDQVEVTVEDRPGT